MEFLTELARVLAWLVLLPLIVLGSMSLVMIIVYALAIVTA